MTGAAPDIEAFRAEVRAFLAAELPRDMAERTRLGHFPMRADERAWTAILARKGWSVPNWPVEYGGTGWTPLQRHVFEEELLGAYAPTPNFQGLTLAGPLICQFGTAEQKAKYLPGIRDGSTTWCQGFSEPNAGSDLAALKTRAVRDGDDYIVNGQKLWTSDAHDAAMMFCLVRTSSEGKRQQGITMLLIDMDTPGLTVRPIRSIDGEHHLNECFLENVRVPVSRLVGEEGKGWDYAKWILVGERTSNAQVPRSKRELARLKDLALRQNSGGRALADDPLFLAKLADIEIDLIALETAVVHELEDENSEINARATVSNPVVPSMLKTRGTQIQQRIGELGVEALGLYGLRAFDGHTADDDVTPPFVQGVTASHLFLRAATIYAGSTEVSKNMIAQTVLAMK